MTVASEPRQDQLTLHLRMAPDYVIGLPFFVEVTLANETDGAEYYRLLTVDPMWPPFPVEMTFTAGGNTVTLPSQSPSGDDARRGFTLVPGEARTFVLDLSELEPELTPGTWRCRARWVMRHEKPSSEIVEVTLTSAEPGDIPLLARLRLAGDAQMPLWANLITAPDGLDDEAVSGLSAQARRALVPYLIVHEAVQGPEPLASFPLEFFAAQAGEGPWASEASVLAYELRWARHAPDLADQRSALLARWPGVQFRLEEIELGAGTLTLLRKEYGPERER